MQITDYAGLNFFSMRVLPKEPTLLTKKSKKLFPWSLILLSFKKKAIGSDDDDVAITTTRTSTTGKIHDTKLVMAIKANEHKASHHTNVTQLEESIASSSSSSSLGSSLNSYEEQLHSRLLKAVFAGHINTDLDLVADAMGVADLFGGTADISEHLIFPASHDLYRQQQQPWTATQRNSSKNYSFCPASPIREGRVVLILCYKLKDWYIILKVPELNYQYRSVAYLSGSLYGMQFF